MPLSPTPPARPHPPASDHGLVPPVLRWPELETTGVVDAVVTTRLGGVSDGVHASLNLGLHVGDDPDAVVENRRRAAATLGHEVDDLVIADQVHGNRVAVVGGDDAGRGARSTADAIAGTDALVTTSSTIVVAVLVADCVPLVLVDPVAGVLGVVHAGWRGTAAGVAPTTVRTMAELGADPGRLVVGIGPAVAPDRYDVGADVADALGAALGDPSPGDPTGPVLTPVAAGRWRCDLVAANRLALTGLGVPPQNIHALAVTTADPDLFSHRAGDGGRFAALARLTTERPDPPAPRPAEAPEGAS